MVKVRSYERRIHFAVDPAKALQLRDSGMSLSEIRSRLNPSAALSSVSRSIDRARREREEAERQYA
jgi:hypothetical protein